MRLSLELPALEPFLLLVCRAAGAFMVAPLVGSERLPGRVKLALAATVSVVLAPVAVMAAGRPGVVEIALAAGGELLVGLAMGFGARLVFTAIQIAGEMADMQSAFGFAGIVSPETGDRTSVIGQLQMAMAWLIFLGANGHHIVLEALAASAVAVPLGASPQLAGPVLARAAVALVAAGVRMSAPVVGAVLLADFGLGLLTRAAPQMNLLAIGFPVKLAVGLGATLLALPLLIQAQRGLLWATEELLRDLMLVVR